MHATDSNDDFGSVDPLTSIGLVTATDKAWLHGYTPHYHRQFQRYRNSEISLLELGVGGNDNEGMGGHSLEMWATYFPKARVLGVDIHDKRSLAKGRITIEQGSQSDPEFAKRIIETHGLFDIIIDDGSHRTDDVTASLKLFWPALKVGGIYAIEDMACAYSDEFRCGRDGDDPLLSANVLASRMTRLFDRPLTTLDDDWSMFEGSLSAIHAVENMVFLNKDDVPAKNAMIGGNETRWVEALKEIEQVASGRDPAPFALTRARILHRMGRTEEARHWIEIACQHRDDAESWHFFGNLLIQIGDVENALRAQLTSIERSNRNPHVHAAVGVAYAKLGKGAEAEAAFEKALAMRPDSTRIRETLARARRVIAKAERK